jgi:mannosyltransferase OCH1-like enzyme
MTIPDILFTYWEGDSFSYLHYFTILSLYTFNPNKNIVIYTSKNSHNSCVQWYSFEHCIDIKYKINFRDVLKISNNISIKEIDFKNEYNISDDLSCVYKADITRIIKLYEHGGMWFDFDILFIKPIPEYIFNNNYDLLYFSYNDTIPTGLIVSTPKNDFITNLYRKCIEKISNIDNSYQQFGPSLWREHLTDNIILNKILLDNNEIYPYLWYEIQKIYIENEDDKISENTWGIHWYNGAPITKSFLNDTNNIEYNNIINKYTQYVLKYSFK